MPPPRSQSGTAASGFYYYSRTLEGAQYRVHCRVAVPPGAGPPTEGDALPEGAVEEVLLDENARKAEGGWSFYMTGSVEMSPVRRRRRCRRCRLLLRAGGGGRGACGVGGDAACVG